jgi:hypothetical protein
MTGIRSLRGRLRIRMHRCKNCENRKQHEEVQLLQLSVVEPQLEQRQPEHLKRHND